MTNEREFYATMTETFFLQSNYFPHDVRDLYEYDRSIYRLTLNSGYGDDIDGYVVSTHAHAQSVPPGGTQFLE